MSQLASHAPPAEERLVSLPWHETAESAFRAHRLVMLVGEPGVGKSTYARHLCRQYAGGEPVVHYGSPVTDITELFGRWVIGGRGMKFIDGVIPLALKQSRPLILEEFAQMPLELRISLLALRSGEQQLLNPMNGEELAISQEFRCLALGNPESIACRRNGEAMQALLSDFLIVHVPPLNERLIRDFLAQQFPAAPGAILDRAVELWNKFRNVSDNDTDKRGGLTYRAAAHLATLLLQGILSEHLCVRVALVNQFITDEDRWNAQQLKHEISQ